MITVKHLLFTLLIFVSSSLPQTFEQNKTLKYKFIQLSGPLFRSVQHSGIFKDSKTFVDAIPVKPPEYIMSLYDSVKNLPDFDLKQFVYANFKIPDSDSAKVPVKKTNSMGEHITELWPLLEHAPDIKTEGSTLLPLPYPYVVPGGRFREIYYWDSYFTILGLIADKKLTDAENMVRNFAYLLDTCGMIPNGNRVYYLTRSQPPFFSLMIDLLSRVKNDYKWALQFLPQMQKEYSFWMNGSSELKGSEYNAFEHSVSLGENEILNRYFDFDTIPREESFREDDLLSQKIPARERPVFFRNLRSAAESGWDFSSRWFGDNKSLLTIETSDIIPVDLNCLIYFMEERLSFFLRLSGNLAQSEIYKIRSENRKALINKYFWNESLGVYLDYNWKKMRQKELVSLAGCFPLFFGIASEVQARRTAEYLSRKMLFEGGLTATEQKTSQQWDAPNGWPPLQYIAVKALREYKLNSLADTIRSRWLRLNERVFLNTGRMVEKYNVMDITLFAGGGEYALQDGFGWTNGVAKAFLREFDKLYIFHTDSAK